MKRRAAVKLPPAGSRRLEMAPQVGLEPTTLRLTAGCSTIELLRNSRSLPTFRWLRDHTETPRDGQGRIPLPGSISAPATPPGPCDTVRPFDRPSRVAWRAD